MADPIVSRLRAAGCVFAEDEACLLRAAARSPDELEAMTAQREAGTPVEYIVGWAEFCGLRIAVTAPVFVPRRRSEFVAETAIAMAAGGAVVLDMCCGTGALGAAVAARVAVGELYAVDIDPVAVRCARRNLPRAHVVEGDLFDPLPRTLRGGVDLLLANAPYVPTDELALMPVDAREHERRVALDGGTDGLEVQRRIIADAPRWLAPQGNLIVETSRRQAPATVAAMLAAGLDARVVTDDERDATVAIATARADQGW